MAGGRLGFWGIVSAACAGFVLLILIVIFAALLVMSLSRISPQVPEEQMRENLAPVGRSLLRDKEG